MRYLGNTRSNLGKNFLHPQKYALPYTYVYHTNSHQMNPKSKLLQRRAVCSTSSWMGILHTVCDVIIARSCGTLPASAAIKFLLTLECVMQLWMRLSLKTVVYFNLRLNSDLEIRLQRKLGSDTTTSFLALQSQFNKAVWNSPLKLSQRCSFQHLDWSGNFVFWASQQRVRQLSSVQCTLHLEV